MYKILISLNCFEKYLPGIALFYFMSRTAALSWKSITYFHILMNFNSGVRWWQCWSLPDMICKEDILILHKSHDCILMIFLYHRIYILIWYFSRHPHFVCLTFVHSRSQLQFKNDSKWQPLFTLIAFFYVSQHTTYYEDSYHHSSY